MRCIVGLGNPGSEYASTRHNVGFMVVSLLAQRHGISLKTMRHGALFGRGVIKGVPTILAQPQTFMNNSGAAARRLLSYYKLEPKHLLVVADDINLDIGVIRIRRSGTHGGQKGLRSITQLVGTDEYARLRLGVGRLESGRDATSFVLSAFRASERDRAEDGIWRAADAVQCALADDLETAMNRFNGPPPD